MVMKNFIISPNHLKSLILVYKDCFSQNFAIKKKLVELINPTQRYYFHAKNMYNKFTPSIPKVNIHIFSEYIH